MRVVVALGGNALLQRGQELSAENQRKNIRVAAGQLAAIHDHHELVIAHGNGPQVGLAALMAPDGEYFRKVVPSPLPQRIIEINTIRMLVERGVVLICVVYGEHAGV